MPHGYFRTMFISILKWTGLTLLAVALALTAAMAVGRAFQKKAEPAQTARLVAERKAKQGVKCTPQTNMNCFTLTAAQLQQIKKMQNGLSRKNN